jgi:hypothetical protein
MTDHRRWQVLAATAMDFELDTEERAELDGHLRACVSCRHYAAGFREDAHLLRALDFGLAPMTVRSRIVAASGLEFATGPSAVLLFIGAILLVLATFGAAIGVGSLLDRRDADRLLNSGTNPVHWQTAVAELRADDFWIEVDGTRFTAPGNVIVHSDPAGTLEMTWQEHDSEMRLNLYFESDGTGWTVREVRSYDGRANGNWIYYDSLSYRAPMGEPMVNDVLVAMAKADNPGVRRATLRLGGLRLGLGAGWARLPNANQPPDAVPVPVPVNTGEAGGAPVDPTIRPVSLSNPGDAAAAIESCHVREFADQVTGMGRLARASDVRLYAQMSNSDARPAWVVTFQGTITFGATRLEDTTCVAFDDGATLVPLVSDPAIQPTLALPPLQP